MNITTILTILVIVATLVLAGTLVYLYLKDKTLEEIRADVYQLILKAEHQYKESGQGKQKMKWVVSQARALLPNWIQAFISEDALIYIIQKWFDAVKDLLDDGKYNQSVKKDGDTVE